MCAARDLIYIDVKLRLLPHSDNEEYEQSELEVQRGQGVILTSVRRKSTALSGVAVLEKQQ